MRLSASSSRRLIGAVAMTCVAALAPVAALAATASPAGHAGTAVATSTPRCTTSGLVIWLDTQGSGTAGSTYYNLEFTNLYRHACTLFGYPGVSGVNLVGHRLGSAASHNAAHAPSVVTLPGGATATVVLRITDVFAFPSSACGRQTAAGLRVYPPNQTASKVVPFPFVACSHTGPVYLSVEAVQKGIATAG